jgi:hypothetical protein
VTVPTPAERIAALRADLVAAETEWDRVDAQGDTAETVRVRTLVEPRIGRLRRAIGMAERTTSGVHR